MSVCIAWLVNIVSLLTVLPTAAIMFLLGSNDTANVPTKTIYALRHAKSHANEWMDQPGNAWGDENFCDDQSLVDSRLSAAGVSQAQELAFQVEHNDAVLAFLNQVELVVLSPLTRCLDTYMRGLHPVLLRRRPTLPPLIVTPLATERVYTCADTGRPWSILTREFSTLDWTTARPANDNEWWYMGDNTQVYKEWRPHHAKQWYACRGEPQSIFEQRVLRLESFLYERNEKVILLVSHWGVLQHITGEDVDNVEIVRVDNWRPRRR